MKIEKGSEFAKCSIWHNKSITLLVNRQKKSESLMLLLVKCYRKLCFALVLLVRYNKKLIKGSWNITNLLTKRGFCFRCETNHCGDHSNIANRSRNVLFCCPFPPTLFHTLNQLIGEMIIPLFKLHNHLVSTFIMLEMLREVERFHLPLAELYLTFLPSLDTVKSRGWEAAERGVIF